MYVPITSNAGQILYTSIKKAVERNMGTSVSIEVIHHLCSISGLTEKELLTNYDLFEKSLYATFGSKKAVDIILHWVKIEMLTEAVVKGTGLTKEQILYPNLTIYDILHYISSKQVFEFVRKIPSHKHVTFFYRNEESKNKALYAFDPAITQKVPTSLILLNLSLAMKMPMLLLSSRI